MGRWVWLLVPAAMVAGCAGVPEMRVANPMALTDSDPATVEQVARRVLAEMRFDVVYPSARPGLLATGPLTGDSWFEFWRDDTVGSHQVAESSIHTVRRSVSLQVTPKGQGSEVLVRAKKERLSAPGVAPEQVSGSFSLYNPRDSDLQRQDELAETKYKWIDMGRDEALEQRILGRIQAALGRGAVR
jgi:hypothetical protein